MRILKHLLLIALCCTGGALLAQPTNDDCTNPVFIPDVTNYCSAVGAYTNVDATPSGYGPATCFNTAENDVWFSFTASATDVTIIVRGKTSQAAGGTLLNPQVSLYLGTCGGQIDQLECQSAPGGSHIVEAYQGGLFVGATYFIRVQGAAGAEGTFQLCINNYNPPIDPTSDCPDASILCDKSPFVVQSVTGAGSNITEMNDATCFFNGSPTNNESNSTWFVWTCSQSGSLEFTLTPLNVADDLDFVVYRLPNGMGNCAGKEVLRCMASGDNVYPSPCMGPTGLRAGDPDVSEDAGCQQSDDDAWLSPLNMIAGETYALAVNNFTSTGNGFSIEFGGTGEFLGPTAEFTAVPEAFCLGVPVVIEDASTFPIGSITAWQWSFGIDAQPLTATGPGPHTVTFSNPGPHPIVLTLETNLGCRVTDIEQVMVFPDVEVDTVFAAPDCNGGTNGAITITNITMGTPPYQYSWENGPFTGNNTLSGLPVGIYNLVIRDANNCETELDIEVKEKELTVAADVTAPLCFGDDNGVITLNVTNGTAPFQFDWGNGFIFDNSEGGFAAGSYTILGLDADLCKGTFEVTVTDNPPVTLSVDTTDVTCFGASDGIGIANPGGGVGNYTYQWSDGQTTQQATGLDAGQYSVTIRDANGCSLTGEIGIVEPPDLIITLNEVIDLLCNGIPEGEIRVSGEGGRDPYSFSPDGDNYFSDGNLTQLPAGEYWVKIKDASGCIDSVFAEIKQPPALQVIATPSDTTLDLGFTVNVNTATAPFGRPVTFEWMPPLGLSCLDCENPVITATESIPYIVKITDETGCMAFDTVNILVNKNRPIYVPNVFSPGKPFPNDHFTLFGGPAAETITLLRVYDRWGSLIFETGNIELGNPNLGWDGTYKGKPVEGVFAFYAYVRFIDQVELLYEGDITVLR